MIFHWFFLCINFSFTWKFSFSLFSPRKTIIMEVVNRTVQIKILLTCHEKFTFWLIIYTEMDWKRHIYSQSIENMQWIRILMIFATGWITGEAQIFVIKFHYKLFNIVLYTRIIYLIDFFFVAGAPHTAAEALLMLLESSPEPLVSPLEEECLYAESFEKCCDLIPILSTVKKNVFIYIIMFLHELLKYNQYNRLDAGKLGKLNFSWKYWMLQFDV